MRARLKPLGEQVIVITGASSGIGLAAARRAARAGAAVVLVARNAEALSEIAAGVEAQGGRALAVPADVGDPAAVARVVEAAVSRFGGFDTWVNNAGVGIYGDLLDVPAEDHQQLFRTNYFGVVNGSLAAARRLKDQPGGGAIVNLGSVLSDIPSPLTGAYVASKHAVKGFTESLRLDLIRRRAPVQVTLIKPASIGSPFPDHARNHMGQAARVPWPVYAPEAAAAAILHAATHRVRSLTVGDSGRPLVAAAALAPELTDRFYSAVVPPMSTRAEPPPDEDSLYGPGRDGRVRTDAYASLPLSPYTELAKRPGAVAAAAILGLAALAAWRGRGRPAAPA